MYRIKYILTPDMLQYHNINVDRQATANRLDYRYVVTCDTCSIPEAVADAAEFMIRHNVRTLVIDGQTMTRD